MPSPEALVQPALVVAAVEGPTSAAVGLPIILVLVAVIVIGFALYAVIRKR